jgi:hypothetical protein
MTPPHIHQPADGVVMAMATANHSNTGTTWSSDAQELWIAVQSANGSSLVMKWDCSPWHSLGDVFEQGTRITGLQVLPLTAAHEPSQLLAVDETLLVVGQLELPDVGNVSTVLFNGTAFRPLLLTSNSLTGEPGRITSFFSSQQQFFTECEWLVCPFRLLLTCSSLKHQW